MGRKKKKKEEASGPPGAPEWIVTFTDMISLLVTFFVLMMTFSSLDVYDAMKIDSLMESSQGIHDTSSHNSHTEAAREDQIAAASIERGSMTPHTRPPDELDESLEDMGQKQSEDHRATDLSNVVDGLVIEFSAEESFAPSSAEPNASLRKSLGEIGEVLSHYPHVVVIEGFTDNAFRPTQEHASADSLSLARARRASECMLEKSAMSLELIQISGHGANLPRGDNKTTEGRQLNRRVQIRVLAVSKLRSNYYETMKSKRRAG